MNNIIKWINNPTLPIKLCWITGNNGPCQVCWWCVGIILAGFTIAVIAIQ